MSIHAEFTASGYVRSQFHMDVRGDQLRVFSGARWGNSGPNYLQIYDIADLDTPTLIDEETFGDGDAIFGAIFLDDRAFAVTYFRVDPFHAFAIDDSGDATEMNEFVVSGWNEFFRPVLDQERLIGIGIDDADGRRLAVSLYDITDLSNPEPLVERVNVSGADGRWDYSEALWDHRAFSILDDAVSVQAPGGETETGIILLPFRSHRIVDGYWRQVNGTQIFTFSQDTLTRRGVMEHGGRVRRSFLNGADTAVNLSEDVLSIYDNTQVDEPALSGSLELAPSFLQALDYSSFQATLQQTLSADWNHGTLAYKLIMLCDDGEQLASIALDDRPMNGPPTMRKLGDHHLALLHRRYTYSPTYIWVTTVEIFDLSDPSNPVQISTFESSELPSFEGGYTWRGHKPSLFATERALVFARWTNVNESIGQENYCNRVARSFNNCFGEPGCEYAAGAVTCRSIEGAPEFCEGGFAICEDLGGGDTHCEPVDEEEVEDDVYGGSCYMRTARRRSEEIELMVLDLSNPAAPVLQPSISFDEEDEAGNLLVQGDEVYVTTKRPEAVPGDSRPHVRYSFTRIDLGDPAQPVFDQPVNIPGELLAVRGDTLYTRDVVWGPQFIDYAIAKLHLCEGEAELESYAPLYDRYPVDMAVDERGRVLVSYYQHWMPHDYYYGWLPSHRLGIFEASRNPHRTEMRERSNSLLPLWLEFAQTHGRYAFWRTLDGLIAMDIKQSRHPKVRKYLPTGTRARELDFDGDMLKVPAGKQGLFEFDLRDDSYDIPMQ